MTKTDRKQNQNRTPAVFRHASYYLDACPRAPSNLSFRGKEVEPKHTVGVYAMWAELYDGSHYAIKIGQSSDFFERRIHLQRTAPYKLHIWLYSRIFAAADEKALKMCPQLAPHRLNYGDGEWFKCNDYVIDFIQGFFSVIIDDPEYHEHQSKHEWNIVDQAAFDQGYVFGKHQLHAAKKRANSADEEDKTKEKKIEHKFLEKLCEGRISHEAFFKHVNKGDESYSKRTIKRAAEALNLLSIREGKNYYWMHRIGESKREAKLSPNLVQSQKIDDLPENITKLEIQPEKAAQRVTYDGKKISITEHPRFMFMRDNFCLDPSIRGVGNRKVQDLYKIYCAENDYICERAATTTTEINKALGIPPTPKDANYYPALRYIKE